MTFTLRQLRYFFVLAQELHFGRAARKLNISQPPLSASLRQLEDSLGAQLLNRSSRDVSLTPAGVAFFERIAAPLSQLNEAQNIPQLLKQGEARTLRIGFVGSMIFRGFNQLLADYRIRNPLVRLELLEMNSAQQIDGLEKGNIDVGFIHAIPLPAGLAAQELMNERFVCAVSGQHRFSARERISLSELVGETVLMFSREHATYYHDHILGFLQRAGIEPFAGYTLRDWFTVLALTGQNMGVSIVPHSLTKVGISNVTFIELEEKDARHRVLHIWNKAGSSPVQNDFLDIVRDFYACH